MRPDPRVGRAAPLLICPGSRRELVSTQPLLVCHWHCLSLSVPARAASVFRYIGSGFGISVAASASAWLFRASAAMPYL